MTAKFIVRCPNGIRWLCEAQSLKVALDEIAHAICTGSVGGSSWLNDGNGPEKLIAKVNRLNSDNTVQRPYQTLY